MRTLLALSMLLCLIVLHAAELHAAELPAVVQKPSVDVHTQPKFSAPKVTTLKRNTAVKISAQQGLWYRLLLPAGAPGYVRVNDVRMAYADKENGDANLRVLMSGKAGKGRVTETAGVRGIDESDLKSARFNQTQLNRMIGYRVDAATASSYARSQRWQSTSVAYASEAKNNKTSGKKSSGSGLGSVGRSIIGSLVGTKTGISGTEKVIPKSEGELSQEELALGPEIAGRILGARPLWSDDSAQRRVNVLGRWVASQTSRAELPWTFGVIDTPEVNAFAAPGGFILLTRGLYQLTDSDSELAAVLAHEISHSVQRDHYNVIHKQEITSLGTGIASSEINVGGGVAGSYAKSYAEKHGASIMLSGLDREAEYRADEAAQIYLARAGMNPLALYAVLQKMTALGSKSAGLAQLYKTHPPLDSRLDRIDKRGYGVLAAYVDRE